MLVQTDIGVTAGAAIGHLDLALWLIRQASPELAAMVSRYLLADIRSLQAPYIIPNHLAQADPLILRFERWSREHLKDSFSLPAAAKALATSRRTLQRRCEDALGKSPLSYFQDCVSNERKRCFTVATSTLKPSPPKWATPTVRPCARCCANAWAVGCATCGPICADPPIDGTPSANPGPIGVGLRP